MLDFERAHAGACLRLHYTDVTEEPDATLNSVREFLGLGGLGGPGGLGGLGGTGALPPLPGAASAAGASSREGAANEDADPDLPLDQIPPPLLAQVNQLHAELGYAQIAARDTR
jgi:hypothetical protein